uniref:Uncharacterized protein n=1 Tax=Arundo donax TaxID=35708 RepID=A0A0A9BA56_ARUDO
MYSEGHHDEEAKTEGPINSSEMGFLAH